MTSFKEIKAALKMDISKNPSFKLAVVGGSATQLLCTAIRGTGVLRGYNINLFEAEYNQVERQFMDPTSDLYQFDATYSGAYPPSLRRPKSSVTN